MADYTGNAQLLIKPRYDLHPDWIEIQITLLDTAAPVEVSFEKGKLFKLGEFVMRVLEDPAPGAPYLCEIVERPANFVDRTGKNKQPPANR